MASDVRPGGYGPVRGQTADDPRVLGMSPAGFAMGGSMSGLRPVGNHRRGSGCQPNGHPLGEPAAARDARLRARGRTARVHRVRRHRSRAGWRCRSGLGGVARGGARHRQVDVAPAHPGAPLRRRTVMRIGVRGGVPCASGGALPTARCLGRRDLVRAGARPGARARDGTRDPSLPVGDRFHPDHPRHLRHADAGRAVPGSALHGCARGAGEGRGHRRAPDRPRHEGRRSRRTTNPRARRRRGPDVRRRSTVGPPGPFRRQEPLRG